MSYRDRDRRDRDDYRGGGDRNRGYGGGRDGGGRDGYGGGRDSYGGGRDSYGGRRDNYGGGGRDRYSGGRDDWGDRRRDGGGRRFGGGGGGYGDDRRSGGGGRFGGGGGGGGRFGGGGGGGRRDGKRMGGFGDGPPSKRQREESNWDVDERHGLMQHVFMESKPENFEEDWVFVVCPPGKRRLLVAANETTQSYNNAGAEDLKFNSCLPSGSEEKGELDKVNDLTILDAVYSGEKKMFYIVDMIHWKHYPYHETESDFRFYCLNDKWAQLKSPEEKTENNEYPLHSLPKFECTETKIHEALSGFDGKIEGLLFVKKQALYKYRESSECQWLKLDKMEKVLGFAVPDGVVYAASNTKDEKRLQEQDQKRKKLEEKAAKGEQEGGNEEEEQNDGAAVSGEDKKVEADGNQDEEMGEEDNGDQ